jgi:hypothetical protein
VLLEKEETQQSTDNMKNIFFQVFAGVFNNCGQGLFLGKCEGGKEETEGGGGNFSGLIFYL